MRWLLSLVLALPVLAASRPFSAQEFEALKAQGRTVVIQFHDAGGVSLRQAEALVRLASDPELAPLAFLQADFDKEQALKRLYHVEAPSTLLLFKGKELLGRSTGLDEEDAVRDFIRKSLAQARGRPKARLRNAYRPGR